MTLQLLPAFLQLFATMFDLLVHVHVIRTSMLSGPSCAGGTFTPSDNWTGNADADNKLAKKGISIVHSPIQRWSSEYTPLRHLPASPAFCNTLPYLHTSCQWPDPVGAQQLKPPRPRAGRHTRPALIDIYISTITLQGESKFSLQLPDAAGRT